MTRIERIYTDWLMLTAILENPFNPCLLASSSRLGTPLGLAGRRVIDVPFLKFGMPHLAFNAPSL